VREVAIKARNFWSLKYRDGLGVGWIRCSDGYDYCYMPSEAVAVAVYWKFIHRLPYYVDVDKHLTSPADFIGYVGPSFCPPGYPGSPSYEKWKTDHGVQNYTEYVLSFLPEATEFLQGFGWKPSTTPAPVPAPVPEPIPPVVIVPPPASIYRVVGDRLQGAIWRPVRNFDRIRLNPQKIIIHFAAALGTGVMDGFDNPLSFRSAHFYSMRAGPLYQCVPLNYWAWAADGWNPVSWNFETENLGCFEDGEKKINSWYDPKTDRFYRRFWPNIVQSAPRSEFVFLKHRKENRFLWWHTYPQAQIATLKQCLPALIAAAPRKLVLAGHDEVEAQKVDPGPAADEMMVQLRELFRS
jgi:hypothetical protein